MREVLAMTVVWGPGSGHCEEQHYGDLEIVRSKEEGKYLSKIQTVDYVGAKGKLENLNLNLENIRGDVSTVLASPDVAHASVLSAEGSCQLFGAVKLY